MNSVLDGRAPLRPDQRPRPAPTGLPPHDIAAEEAVIAALLLDEEAVWRVEPILQAGDFLREQNGWAYHACLSLAGMGEAITIPALCHELDRRGLLDAAGGEVYYAEIAGKYFTAIGVETHARIVKRCAVNRALIQVAGQLAQMAYEDLEPEQVIAQARANLQSLERRLAPRETGTGIRVEGLFSE